MTKTPIIIEERLKDKIFTVRGVQVMLDSDLAKLYQANVKRLNEQVKRNIERFPERFRFQLTKEEFESLKSQIATLEKADVLRSQIATSKEVDALRSQFVILETKKGKGEHKKYLPFVFTEQGVSMLSAVLRSDIAVRVSIQIIDAFVTMRRFISHNAEVFSRIERLELGHRIHTEKIDGILNALEDKSVKPKKGIFYDKQMFDAHVFVSKIIRSAKKSIVLIDNFIDENVLQLLHKRNKNVKVVIYTKDITKALKQDIKKYNSQYESKIEVKSFIKAHDRFLIIDDGIVYHFGASLKDLGKRWFAFSKFDKEGLKMLQKLN